MKLDDLAMPLALLMSALGAWVLRLLAGYLRERTHNEQLARVVDAASRVAATIHAQLGALPTGAPAKAILDVALTDGVAALNARFPATLESLGQPKTPVLRSIILGELGKLAAAAGSRLELPSPPLGVHLAGVPSAKGVGA